MGNNRNLDNKDDQRLAKIANEFINSKEKKYVSDNLIYDIHNDLQNEIKSLYSKIKNKFTLNSEQSIVDSIAELAGSKHDEKSVVFRMFPKYYKETDDGAMECTLASAILKLALEEKGFQNIYTVLLKGHQITMRVHNNGSITLHDPSTRWTDEEDVKHGFMHKFEKEESINNQIIHDNEGKFRGFKFRLETKEKPANTGMFGNFDSERKVYYHNFFASEPNTLIELSVVLENLNDLKDKDSFDSLKDFDADEAVEKLGIFNYKTFFKLT